MNKISLAAEIARLETAVAQRQTPDGYVALGKAYLGSEVIARSLAAFAEAVLLDPSNQRAAILLAKVARKVGRQRSSIGDALAFARDAGFNPTSIIDIGVNTGTPGLYEFFPDANILLVDPVAENEPFLQKICEQYPKARYELAAAGPQDMQTVLSISESFSNSRVGSGGVGQINRHVPMRRIDSMVSSHLLSGPYILKTDTEGYELEVLAGAPETLRETEIVIIEAAIIPLPHAPSLLATLSYLDEAGFAFYDFAGRGLASDLTLKFCDLVAVRKQGFFRASERYRRLSPVNKTKPTASKLRKRAALARTLGISNGSR